MYPVSVIISCVIGCLTVFLRHILGLKKDVFKAFLQVSTFSSFLGFKKTDLYE